MLQFGIIPTSDFFYFITNHATDSCCTIEFKRDERTRLCVNKVFAYLLKGL